MKKLQPYSQHIIDAHRKVCQKIVEKKLDAVEKGLSDPLPRRYVQTIRRFLEKTDGFVATADKIREIVERVERKFFFEKDLPDTYKELNKKLENKVFLYDYFRDGRIKGTEGHANAVMNEFVKHVKICPYCNADSVYALEVVERHKENKTPTYKSAFDHFYPKSRYPFLGLSLYNLIPSCDRCNSKFKQDSYKETLNILHPYLDDVDDVSRFVLVNLDERMEGKESPNDRAIQLRSLTEDGKSSAECEPRLRQYKALFGVDVVYSTLFKEEARETLQLGQVMNEEHLNEIKRWLVESGLPNVDPWQLMLGTPLDRSQIDRHWLLKLKLDVLEGYCGVTVLKGKRP